MKRKALALALAAITTMSLALTGCGSSASSSDTATSSNDAGTTASTEESESDSESTPAPAGDGTSIRLLNNKAEIDTGLGKLADAYEKETGVHVEVESIGAGQDTQAVLKGYYQADNMPDIFVFEGETHYPTWEGLLADLSDEAWVNETEAEFVHDGVVYGFPTTTEAIGLAYNADILEKAGIDPAKITGPDSMREAFETLDAKKDELGLTAVVGYYTEASQLWWTAGQHLLGTYLDSGLKRDDTTYIDLFNDGGQFDEERGLAWANMVALFNEFTDDNGVSGTYDDQIRGFASGEYAFVTQGSWIGATITSDDVQLYEAAGSFDIGMIPYAFIEGQDTILTNSPNWWGLYNEGNVEAAKAFIQWCSENDGGQQILAEECGCISPFTNSTWQANDPFAATIAEYTAAGKTSAWHWQNWKEGLGQNATAVVFQDFAKGTIPDTATFLSTLEQVCADYYAK